MQVPCNTPAKADELPLFVWATRIIKRGDGRAELVAVKPKKEISVAEAAEIIGCSRDSVWRTWRAGLITGTKAGARSNRRDGRASNATLSLDAESVMRYKESRTRRGVF